MFIYTCRERERESIVDDGGVAWGAAPGLPVEFGGRHGRRKP